MTSATTAPIWGIKDEVAALKRERTISVAAELFYERGYANTSLDAVAERMNVTKPFIYAHFTSKAELLAEICSRGIASALAALDGVLMDVPGPPAVRLAEVGRRFVTAVLNSQRHIAIFAREEKNLAPEDFRRISDMRRDFDRKLVGLLDEGVAAGEFHVADTRMAASDGWATALSLWVACESVPIARAWMQRSTGSSRCWRARYWPRGASRRMESLRHERHANGAFSAGRAACGPGSDRWSGAAGQWTLH